MCVHRSPSCIRVANQRRNRQAWSRVSHVRHGHLLQQHQSLALSEMHAAVRPVIWTGYRHLPSLEAAGEEVVVAVQAAAVGSASAAGEEEVVAVAPVAEPASAEVTAAELLLAAATEAAPLLVAEKAWAERQLQEAEASSWTAVHYRYRHRHHRRRNPTGRVRRQV